MADPAGGMNQLGGLTAELFKAAQQRIGAAQPQSLHLAEWAAQVLTQILGALSTAKKHGQLVGYNLAVRKSTRLYALP